MSINIWEVYLKCPKCGETTTAYDYHENTSSDNTEIFCVLNIGKQSNHLWLGNPMREPCFRCPHCNSETSYGEMFSEGNCQVENLDRYKVSLRRHIRWADKNGNVTFSDWDPNWGEEPALSRLIAMYPLDTELKRIKEAYRMLHLYGKRAISKIEVHSKLVSREMILVPEVLERVYLGNEVKRIDSHTFENCEALSDIFIPDSVFAIGDHAFARSGLYKVHVSNNIKDIGKKAFFHTWISRFFFPEAIQNVGAECFAECPYLNNLWIPPNVHIGQNAFADCQSLKRVQVAGTVPAEVIDTWGLNEDCTIERYEI